MGDANFYVLLERNLSARISPAELPHGYSIRRFAKGDSNVWTSIQNRVFEPHKARDFDSLYGENFSGEGVFFAQHGHESVGISAGLLRKTPGGVAFGVIDWVGVLKEHRRHGVARALVTAVMEHLRLKGLPFVSLATPAYRVNGIELYKKLGFELIASNEKHVIDNLQIVRAEALIASDADRARQIDRENYDRPKRG